MYQWLRTRATSTKPKVQAATVNMSPSNWNGIRSRIGKNSSVNTIRTTQSRRRNIVNATAAVMPTTRARVRTISSRNFGVPTTSPRRAGKYNASDAMTIPR